MKRTTLGIFSLAALLMLSGLLILASDMLDARTRSISPASSFSFSLGALLMGAGFMLRAREAEERSKPTREIAQQRQNLVRTNGLCVSCKKEPAIMRCNTHNSRLCVNCISGHDSVYCEYVPCGRKSTAAKARPFR